MSVVREPVPRRREASDAPQHGLADFELRIARLEHQLREIRALLDQPTFVRCGEPPVRPLPS